MKVWGMEKEGEEFSVIITHNSSVKDFLVVFFDLLETDFLVDKKTMEDVKDLLPKPLLEIKSHYQETWSSTATIQKTRLKALENESELQPDIFQQEFPKVYVKEETKKEVIGIPAWDSVVVEEEENPATYNVNDIRFIDDFLGDQEDGEEETSLLVSTQKNKSKSQAENELNLMCDVTKCSSSCLIFKTMKELKIHHKAEHSELICPKCNHVSPSDSELMTHNCNKRYKCNQCQRLFSTNHELKSHSYIHSGEKPHMCDHCGKGFRQRATLDRHKLTHESKRKYSCDICHKKFKFKHYLVSHKLLHSGVKPHMCTWCGMRFAQNANMQKHIRQQHTLDKSHVCKYCGKGFVQPYYLRRHMSCHKEASTEKATLDMLVESHTSSDEQTGIRTLSCIFCSVTCKGQQGLKNHVNKHHQDILNADNMTQFEEMLLAKK